MKVLLIGATGQTGRLVARQLIEQGHHVTALARRPEAVDTQGGRVKVVAGDATRASDLERALSGQEAIISTLGTRSLRTTHVATAFTQALLRVAPKYPAQRFVNLSAWGAGGSADHHYPAMKLARQTLLKRLYDDKDRAEALLTASSLPYINVRPGRLTGRPARGQVRATLVGRNLSHSISRADVAGFLIDQLTSDTWLRQSPLIGYAT